MVRFYQSKGTRLYWDLMKEESTSGRAVTVRVGRAVVFANTTPSEKILAKLTPEETVQVTEWWKERAKEAAARASNDGLAKIYQQMEKMLQEVKKLENVFPDAADRLWAKMEEVKQALAVKLKRPLEADAKASEQGKAKKARRGSKVRGSVSGTPQEPPKPPAAFDSLGGQSAGGLGPSYGFPETPGALGMERKEGLPRGTIVRGVVVVMRREARKGGWTDEGSEGQDVLPL